MTSTLAKRQYISNKKIRRPKAYQKKPYQYAATSPSFHCEDGLVPACLYLNCDGVDLKDAKKLSVWLKKAIIWLEAQK